MILKQLRILSLLIFTATGKMLACSCMPAGYHFCETIQNDPQIASIVMVQKLSDYYYGMDVKVLQNISGETTEDTIRIWGDNGALCRLYTGGWAIGDTIIMAIHHTDLAGNLIYNPDYPANLEDSADYHVSGCGVYSLDVHHGIVTGPIDANTMQAMLLNTFMGLGCLQILGTEDHDLVTLTLYPNPASDLVRFTSNHENMGGLTVSIYNSLGQVLYQQENFSLDGSVSIEALPKGAYNLILSNGTIKRSFCFIKQ